MAALQEIPGNQRHSASTAESLFHMIACCSYHLAKVCLSLFIIILVSLCTPNFVGIKLDVVEPDAAMK